MRTGIVILLIQLVHEISNAAWSSLYWKGKLRLDKALTCNAYGNEEFP